MSLYKIAFCGRPNVGKSSLFNRLLGKRQALVLDQPGVTRDVRTSRGYIGSTEVEFADLAGLEHHEKDPLQKLAMAAAIEYLKQADLALFVVDARAGLTPTDEDIARLVRTHAKLVVPILSKAESNSTVVTESAELLRLGFGEGVATSAEHNLGIDDLRTIIATAVGIPLETLNDQPPEIKRRKRSGVSNEKDRGEIGGAKGLTPDRPITLGVYGRPNVGKSTLVNAILGMKRMIVSPIAGTTVDAVDTDMVRDDGTHFRIVDTAGIRRKSKTEQGVEVLSVVQAMSSLPRVDVAVFVLDGFEGVTEQDEKVAGALQNAGRATIIVVNKWDICQAEKDKYAERVRKALPHLDFSPLVFLSAEKGQGLEPLFELIPPMLEERMQVVSTAELNRVVKNCESKGGLKGAKVFYSVQVSKNPPTIRVQVSDPKRIHYTFERQLKNELRAHFGWMGSPLKLLFVSKH